MEPHVTVIQFRFLPSTELSSLLQEPCTDTPTRDEVSAAHPIFG